MQMDHHATELADDRPTLCERGRVAMISTHGYVAAEPYLGQPDTGGQVVYVLELAKAIHALGCEVDVITRRFEGQPEVDEMGDGLRVLRIPFGGDDFVVKEDFHDILPEFVENFLAKIEEEGTTYGLLSSHYWDAGVGAQAVADKLGVPHVHTPHSLGAWKKMLMGEDCPPEKLATYRFEERIAAEQRLYEACDFLVATTHQQHDRFEDLYGIQPEKVAVLPAGLDDAKFHPVGKAELAALREKHGFRPHDILSLGRMARNKGYDLLIDAMPKVLQTVPEARLILCVGAETPQDEAQINELKLRAGQLGLQDHIEWRGYVSDEDLPEVYRCPGVFAMPSRYEPFGMTAIEAMASGTPTVITVHGGLMEQVGFGSHALFADPAIPDEFSTQLTMPLRYDEVADRLGDLGPKWTRKEFAWRSIAKRMMARFEKELVVATGA